MKSKTLIEKQMQKKVNPDLVKTIIAAKKNENWLEVAGILSKPSFSMLFSPNPLIFNTFA